MSSCDAETEARSPLERAGLRSTSGLKDFARPAESKPKHHKEKCQHCRVDLKRFSWERVCRLRGEGVSLGELRGEPVLRTNEH